MGFLRLTPSKETDEELLRLYKQSCKLDHFGKLYDRYIPLIYGVCLRYLQNEDDAQDAVMQLFEELYQKVLKQDIQTFRTWLYTVSSNHCLQILREKKRFPKEEFKPDFMESEEFLYLLDGEDDNNDRIDELQSCIERLPEQQRLSVNHFFNNRLSYAEISEVTGFSLAKVKSYIQNGKRNLKIFLEEKFEKR